jgi:hypothetical protein
MGRDVVRQMCARDGKHFSADRLTSTGGIRDLTSVDGRVRSLPKTVDAAE